MKRILCPFDFSDAAINAADYAGHLAQNLNMELLLLHIEQIPLWQGTVSMASGYFLYVEDETQTILEKLKTHAASVQKKFKIKCKYAVKVYGLGLVTSLNDEIRKAHFDLVVMGTSGIGGLAGSLFSTNTYQMIRKTEHPLLMVPEKYAFKQMKKVIYATDYCPDDHYNIKNLLALTAPYNPVLTVLHVSKKGSMVSDEVFRCFKEVLEEELNPKQSVEFRRMVGKDVPAILHDVMHNADLLVLLTKHYNFIEKIFHRSTIRKLSFIADYPILVYPEKIER